MPLLGAASTVPIALFVPERCVIHRRFHPCRSHDQCLGASRVRAFRGHRRNMLAAEPASSNLSGLLRALFAIALRFQLLPISRQRIQTCGLVLDFPHGLGGVARRGVTLPYRNEIDREYAECGQSALGRNIILVPCIGVPCWARFNRVREKFHSQFAGIVGRSNDGTMLICSMSMACVMLLSLATNTLITKDMLHEVALFGRGKLAFHVPDEAIREGKQAKPLIGATDERNRFAQPECWPLADKYRLKGRATILSYRNARASPSNTA